MCLYARAQEDIEWTPAASGQLTQQAQGGLEVGDTIPDELWDTPLSLWSVTDNKTKTVTLNDYRGKVIVLDFWNTHCTTCIYNMPKMLDLEESSPDKIRVLPVTKEGDTTLAKFFERINSLARYKPLVGLPVFSLVDDEVLYNTFPPQSLPHLVVLNPDGQVAAITQSQFLDIPTLNAIYEREHGVYIPLTRKRLESPLLELSSEYILTNRLEGKLYYSTLTGYIDGIEHQMSLSVNEEKGVIWHYISNTTVDKLYASALSSPLPIDPKRRILELNKPSNYGLNEKRHHELGFMKENYYTYEVVAPSSVGVERVKKRMKADLDFMLGLHGRIEQRPVKCWVIRIKQGAEMTEGDGRSPRSLVYAMNIDLAVPIVINETGYGHERKTPMEMPLPEGQTLAEYNALLDPIGLELVEETRMLDMFVLTENHEK